MIAAGTEIIRRSLWERAIKPTLTLLTVVVMAVGLYNNFWRLGLPSFQRIAGHLFGLPVFFSMDAARYMSIRRPTSGGQTRRKESAPAS